MGRRGWLFSDTPSGPKRGQCFTRLLKLRKPTTSLSEFSTEEGVNQQKYSSFELFRRDLVNPEIITFDELYERACNNGLDGGKQA